MEVLRGELARLTDAGATVAINEVGAELAAVRADIARLGLRLPLRANSVAGNLELDETSTAASSEP